MPTDDINDIVSKMNNEKWDAMTPRQRSRKMDNYRKRLRRRKISSEKMLENENLNSEEKEAIRNRINAIDRSIQESFYNRKEKSYNIKAIQSSEINEEIVSAQTQIRKNLQFQRELMLGHGKDTESKKVTRAQATTFYYTTKEIWNKEGVIDRNAAIMQYFGTNSLEEAFNIVMANEEVKKQVKRYEEGMEKGLNKIQDTEVTLNGKEKDVDNYDYHYLTSVLSSRVFG